MTQIPEAKHVVVVLLPAGLLAASAPAQEGPLSLELSFSNPGARSMGFGVAVDSFQIDAAVDFSDLVDIVSLSAIYSS